MKATIKLLSLLIIISTICSCNHSNTLGRMIPKNAMVIVQLNGRSLSSKLMWEDVKQSPWFTKIYSDSNTRQWIKKIMENPDLSGIDNKGDMVFFVLKATASEGEFVVKGDIKDVNNFESFCKNVSTSNGTVTDDGIKYLTLKNNGVVGWNSKKFAFVFNKTFPEYKNDSDLSHHAGYTGSLDLLAACKNLFHLKEDSSMRSNNNFTTLLNEPADIHIWQNTEEIVKNGPPLGMLGMLKLDVFIKNNVSAYAINFEDGKIDVKQKWYASKELMDVLKKYGGGNINAQMIKNIPSQDIIGMASLHFKPQGLAEIIKLTGMDGMLNMILSSQGFNLDDFVKANKGDIQIVATDLKITKDSSNNESTSVSLNKWGDSSEHFNQSGYHTSANFLFSASIGDKASFEKIMAAGKKLGNKMKKDSGITYAMNENFFVLGNNDTYVQKYNTGSNYTFTFLDKIKDHPISAYLDLNKILASAASSASKDTTTKPLLNTASKMWDKLYVTGGEIEDGALGLHTEILMNDRSTNSLKQLNNFLNQAAQLKHHNFWHHHSGIDSLHGYMDSSK